LLGFASRLRRYALPNLQNIKTPSPWPVGLRPLQPRGEGSNVGQGLSLASSRKSIEDEFKIPDKVKSELATDFFHVFARFEYALKTVGYYKNQEDAKPNWDKFAIELEDIFQNPSPGKFADAVNYFKENPPKKQIINSNNELGWALIEPSSYLADKILIYVKKVRNNLFHGGKASTIPLLEPRDEKLLKHSLVILKKCLSENSKVRMAFER